MRRFYVYLEIVSSGLTTQDLIYATSVNFQYIFHLFLLIYKIVYFRIFSKQEIEEIRNIKLWDVIVNSTNIDPKAIQKNVFYWVQGDPCPQPMQLNISLMEPCKILGGYDYFEVSIILTFY